MPDLSDHRPTSPHLSIYRLPLAAKMSITHRLTGVALYGGTALLVAWLWAAAYNVRFYHTIYGIMNAWYGKVLLVGWTFAFFFHFANGIRHMNWDIGRGFDLKNVARTGWFAIGFSVALTALTWAFVMGVFK